METLSYPKETKAKKEHLCGFCNEIIYKGEIYLKSTHTYDREIYDWKSHKHCSNIADKLNMYEDCDEGLTQDSFMEAIHNEHDNLLIKLFPQKDIMKYRDVIQQLRSVNFKSKLGYVIRHHNKATASKIYNG